MNILVIDDNYDFRTTLIEYLQGRGHVTDGASNGNHGLQKMREKKYDLILLDLDMPIMDGRETIRKLEKSQNNTSIIVITGIKKPEKYFYYEKGILSFEKKPLDLIELDLKIKNIFDFRKKRAVNQIPEETIIALDINSIYDLILDNISDENLNVDFIAEELFVSKKILYERVSEILTISVHDMIKNVRLLYARQLIEKREIRSSKELSSKVGYKDSGYFKKLYTKAFGEDMTKKIKRRSYKLKPISRFEKRQN
ncbi:MAG: response regulator [Balneolaceae bacterium]|nr:response regulator [Balneolaceae bacterium]MDR9408753.1 response regulator [Balneolaceae bacterium]